MSTASPRTVWGFGALILLGGALQGEASWAAVGRTEATFGVSPTGAASYSIPVLATEGIGGLAPDLSIRYAGPEARGILGTGMTLGGLSSIGPCRRSIAQDGAAGAVRLQSTDAYCLDGARLRLVSGTYGASGAVYRTELEQFARITSYDSVDGRPGWFKVETRDGLIHEYGHSTDSVYRAGTLANSPIQLWALGSTRDRSGNTIVFQYQNDPAARLFRPELIRYTDSALAGSGRYTVRFVYQPGTRPDPVLAYTPSAAGGASRLESGLLERLELRHDAVTYRQLLFTYEAGAGANTRLASVQTCAATTSECFPPTTLGWQSASVGHAAPTGTASVNNYILFPLDINGDGFDDLAWDAGTWWYMLGGPGGYAAPVNTGVGATNSWTAMPLDWNGDGLGDLLVESPDGYWWVLKGSATGLAFPVAAGPGAGIPSNTPDSAWWFADVDGDGRDDLLRASTAPGPAAVYVRLNGASGFGAETLAYADANLRFNGNPFPPSQSYRQSVVHRADFDGDGRGDLLLYACTWDSGTSQCLWSGWFALTANGTGFANQGNIAGAVWNVAPLLGHFNADALTDVAFPSGGTNAWCLGLSQGGAGFAYSCGPSTNGYWTFMSAVADYDADGYDDLYAYASSGGNQWHVIRSTGTGIAPTAIATGIPSSGSQGWVVSDPTGDGLADLGARAMSGGTWQTRAHLGVPGERLASALDGLGASVAFTHAPLTEATVHTRSTNAVYPTQDLQRPWWVVRQLTATDGSGSGATYTETYSYEGARREATGRGFLGFAKRVVVDGRLGYNLRTEESYSQSFPYIGRPTRVMQKQSSGTTIRSIDTTWSTLSYGSGYEQARHPYAATIYDRRYEAGGAKDGQLLAEIRTTVAAVDATSGLVTDRTVRNTEFYTGLYSGYYRYEREQHTSVLNDAGNWCLGRPQTTLLTAAHTLSGGTAITRTTGQTWDAANCRLVQRQLEPGHAQWQVTLGYGYDGFGNRTSESVTGIGMAARTDTLDFGTRGQRLERHTNALGQQTLQAWDYAQGVATSVTDPNGLTTAWSHDGFGRRVLETRPDQTRTAWARASCPSGCDPRTRYTLTATELDAAGTPYRSTVTEYDRLDQAVRVATQLPGGYSVATTERDARGRVTRQYRPHVSGTPHDGYTQYTYDLLDRVTAETDHSATGGVYRTRSTAYNGLALTRTNARGHTTTELRTAWGDRMRVTDAAGNASYYRYDALGRLTRLIDLLNRDVRVMAYSVSGAQTSEVSLNRGTTTYTPNALGERIAETDAKSQTRTFAYDALGRLVSRTEPEGTTTWSWGASAAAHDIGRIASVSAPGISESYSYDSLGRPVTRTITSDATYQFDYTYNAQGQLDTLTYPASTGGFRLKLGYEYQAGQLSRIKDANDPATVPWQLNTMDAAGRVLDETLGAGVRVVTGFDSDGGRLSSRQAGVGGGNTLQNLHYEWDANDNLTARRDYQQSPPVYETFSYDALDRIDSSMRNGTPNLDVNYDATGNVTSKSDVGSYTYDATKIHAVKTAGSNTYSYDANGNVVSRNGSYLGWTSYDRPSRIDNGAGTVSYLWYDAERRLWRQEAYSSGAPESTVYVGELLEKVTKDGITSWKHYVEAPTGTAAVYLRRSDGTASTYYLTHDHLGSTDKVLDASGGIVTVAESFTALGARRGANWQGTPTPAELAAIASTTRDGFTGHVMLDNVGLVHMQGRVYDPSIGRFLSVDPVVRDVAAAQSWNGYGYVEGRVTSWTDPTGYSACPGRQPGSACTIVPINPTVSNVPPPPPIPGNVPVLATVTARKDLPPEGISAAAYTNFWGGVDSLSVVLELWNEDWAPIELAWLIPAAGLCVTDLPGVGTTYLDSDFNASVQEWLDLNRASGINITFTEAFRTTEYQGTLAQNAASITPAQPGQSLHEAGFAVDVSWRRLTEAQRPMVVSNADRASIRWGGNFGRPDPVHFYRDPGNRQSYIQAAQQRYRDGASKCQ